MKETRNQTQLIVLNVPYGQITALAKRFRTTPKTISSYLRGDLDEWARNRDKQMRVREYAIKTYRL